MILKSIIKWENEILWSHACVKGGDMKGRRGRKSGR